MSNTRPFISPIATPGIEKVQSGDYRSAFSVKKLQTYCWFENHPVNYDPNDMAQTQDLERPLLKQVDFTFSEKRTIFNPIHASINQNIMWRYQS